MGKVKRTILENRTKDGKIKVLCPKCKKLTNHKVLVSVDEQVSEEVDELVSMDWEDNYQIIQCQGCDDVSFRHLSYFSEYDNPENNDDGLSENLYPRRTDTYRSTKDFYKVPPDLRRIYRETVDCLNQESYTLSTVGLRAIVERVCADQNVKDGEVPCTKKDGTQVMQKKDNLEGKIFGLAQRNILTTKNAEILHELRFLGNDAVHELIVPSKTELNSAIDIVEHILETLYEIPIKGKELATKRKHRKSKSQ